MNIHKQAIEMFGKERQFNKAIEECNELAVSINHLREGKATRSDVLLEMADVEIMIYQMLDMLGYEKKDLDSAKEVKLNRLSKKIIEFSEMGG